MIQPKIANKAQLSASLKKTTTRLVEVLDSFDQEEINRAPAKGSWTAAQVADHITRSNISITKALALGGTAINRDPGERIEELRRIFLDFSTRLKSPDFILPTQELYKKEIVMETLRHTCGLIDEIIVYADLSEMITHPAFGDITKFEILHFVLFHTQRHIRQLENIGKAVSRQNKFTHMRKLKLQMQVSIDGYCCGPNGELDWMTWNWDDNLKHFVSDMTDSSDCILLGRKMTDGFIAHWSKAATQPDSPESEFAKKMMNTPKVVFSKTLAKSPWDNSNTSLATGNLAEEVNKLKSKNGKDIIVYGGAGFVSSLIKEGLIDELSLFINPTAIGKGLSIFGERTSLQLLRSRSFACGITVLTYAPSGK